MAAKLKEKLNDDLKQAMKGGDTVKRSVIRQALAAIQSSENARRATLAKAALAKLPRSAEAGKEPELPGAEVAAIAKQAELADSDILGVLAKEARQRQESIEAFKQGNRSDLAAKEETELAILQGYLPAQASREELESIAQQVISEVGARGRQDMGKVMPQVMARLRGRADGRLVSQVVQDLLSRTQL